MIRVPIGGADFSTHPYTYNEYPWYDAGLSNYSLTDEDLFYKVGTYYEYLLREAIWVNPISIKEYIKYTYCIQRQARELFS